MAVSSLYSRRKKASFDRILLRFAMLRAQDAANADPGNVPLQDTADSAAEKYLRNEERLELIEAMIDESLSAKRRVRFPGEPDQIDIRLRIRMDRQERVRARRIRRGLLPVEVQPLAQGIRSVPTREMIELLTPEAAQAESDARRAEERRENQYEKDCRAERAAQRALVKLKKKAQTQ